MIKNYDNFVKASTSKIESQTLPHPAVLLSGDQARKIYLEEVKDAKTSSYSTIPTQQVSGKKKIQRIENISNKDLFLTVQNNDVKVLKNILDSYPSMIATIDEFGWSLLMIACQANSVDAVKELLKRGADTSVRDKGGNTATNLVVKNKNLEIADLLISHKVMNPENNQEKCLSKSITKPKHKAFACESCNKVFPYKEQHLSSTLHNINASKGKKVPTNYKIPQSNRGFQIMLKVGWDRDLGLGKDGCGNKYPLKTVQKLDKKGLGHENSKEKSNKDVESKPSSKSEFRILRRKERRLERDFRREFY